MLISSKTITEGNQRLYFTYGSDDERVMTELVELDGSNETTLLKKYFFGLYEQESEGAAQRHIHYIMAGDGLTAIVVEENAERNTYFTYKDHLGSIVTLTDEEGDVFFEQNFDAWGKYRNPNDWSYSNIQDAPTWLRGYTGHEHLMQFDLVNMNGRMYDPTIGRMLRPDNFVQEPTNSQSYNRYSYVFNNPLKYADPNGEIAFAPILLGMAYGALIGAGTSALIYSVTTAASGNEWSWNSFGRATAMGAVGGALGGGFGALGSQLGSVGQSLGYNLFTNIASNSATSLAFGENISWGSFAGMTMGGVIGAGIGSFSGVSGGAVKNILAEIGFGTWKGAVTGGFGGAIEGAINKNGVESVLRGMQYGAISGGTLATLNVLAFGAAYKPSKEYGDFGNSKPVYRRGHFLWPKSTGISIGRNLVTRLTGDMEYDEFLRAHETGHYYQQSKLGFANFYGKTIGDYIKHGQHSTYSTGGTLEFGAQIYSLNKIGYFWSYKHQLYINNSNYNNYYPNVPKSVY